MIQLYMSTEQSVIKKIIVKWEMETNVYDAQLPFT